MENILKDVIENEMREEIAEDLRAARCYMLKNAPAYAASMREEAHTDRDRVTLAKNHVLMAIEELEEAGVTISGNDRISNAMRDLEAIEDSLADELEERGEPTNGTTWHGLNAEAMASILDELWGAGKFDDETWDEWFKMYGSPYRVMPSKRDTENAMNWQVTAIPDDEMERVTMALFSSKSDADAYADIMGYEWEPMVTAITH